MTVTNPVGNAQQPAARPALTPMACPLCKARWKTQKAPGRWQRCEACWRRSGNALQVLVLVPAPDGSSR